MQGGEVRDDAGLAIQQQLRTGWICLQEVAKGDAHVPQILHPICSTSHAEAAECLELECLPMAVRMEGSALSSFHSAPSPFRELALT